MAMVNYYCKDCMHEKFKIFLNVCRMYLRSKTTRVKLQSTFDECEDSEKLRAEIMCNVYNPLTNIRLNSNESFTEVVFYLIFLLLKNASVLFHCSLCKLVNNVNNSFNNCTVY